MSARKKTKAKLSKVPKFRPGKLLKNLLKRKPKAKPAVRRKPY